MKVLIVGTEGQLSRSLLERGRSSAGIEVLAFGRPELDLEVPGSAARAISAVSYDVVINAAAYTAVDQAEDEPERALRINADAAGEIARVTHEVGARLVHISTDYVFDGLSLKPYDESAAPNPLSVYGRSKLEGEEQVRASNPAAAIVRTAWVYSPFGRNFVKTILAAAQTRDALTVVDDQRGSPSSALDLADGLLVLLRHWRSGEGAGLGETYHLAGTGFTSWFGFAQAIIEECRKHGLSTTEVRPIRTGDWPTRAVRPPNSVLSSAKFARDFGFVMRPWRDSVVEVVSRLAACRYGLPIEPPRGELR
jgi:dTDP-4-dehydrorhamnose reductase